MAVQDYEGGCQCGAVRFKTEIDLDSLMTCNCSRCGRTGAIMAFTSRDKFEQTAGQDAMTDFTFNTGKIHHPFCKTCGIEAFGYGEGPGGAQMAAVNVRCLDDIDVHTLEPNKYDGKGKV
jgi:hypothetical protein